MAYEPKESYGGLFKEKEKKSENGPDYRGNIMLGGKVYELAGWIKSGASGNFLSLKGQEPRAKPDSTNAPRNKPKDDLIPF